MLAWVARLPLIVTLIGVGGLAMLIPAIHAAATGEARIAEIFFYEGALTLVVALFIGIAMAGRPRREHPRRHLAGLLALFVALPFLFALPFYEAVGNTSFLNAYVEMVSALTTTGATLFDDPARLAPPLHTWRATVGWLGGLFIWVGAISVLAPMALGGFEVRRRAPSQEVVALGYAQITERADLSQRVRAHAAQLLPIYSALTLLLWGGLLIAGDSPSVALAHAMSTLSTSGISPVGGLGGGAAGWGGEVVVAVFLVFALSRITFAREGQGMEFASLRHDPEIRIALALITLVPGFLFLRHFLGAYEVGGSEMSVWQGLGALWGSVFTVLSFLTTAGWHSEAWTASQDWSGLQTPGLILLGLALIGGGVATTAGGAKLLRVYALYKHGVRELERLVHPHSVGGSGGDARHLRRRGAYMAWLFFMLMALSVALVMGAFSFTGESFEQALVLTVAALTTTGPLAALAEVEPISYGALSVGAKYVLTAAMILGRLETLAIVALFSPDLWRR
ncbi:potassium transporter TrkG [Sinisalibacter aestuarii]|uniref:Potassium transporter TrkH n=1 Tax=Sinisalibacter aestuarii TaxID=2949426 RepID=A0ABQ5LX95_9RHOB|nr:potassium transporter TrkG [Sinisalibacter aestuarii]GKY89001.1 potassium transporter TrkH [Sinisalibacter aestuarii]